MLLPICRNFYLVDGYRQELLELLDYIRGRAEKCVVPIVESYLPSDSLKNISLIISHSFEFQSFYNEDRETSESYFVRVVPKRQQQQQQQQQQEQHGQDCPAISPLKRSTPSVAPPDVNQQKRQQRNLREKTKQNKQGFLH